MAKKDEMLFGRPVQENSELVFEGVAAPVADAKHYALQPTSQKLPAALANAPQGRFQEQVLKGSDEVKSGAKDAHPAENQPG